jgi:hypothetical protein
MELNIIPQGIFDAALIANKNAVSKYFAEELESNDPYLAQKAFTGVTSDSATVTSAVSALDKCITTSRRSRSGSNATILANFKSISKWNHTHINVCWENPTASNEHYRNLVQIAVAETWVKYSQIKFIGWKQCSTGNQGIHIVFDDKGWPHTRGLGKQLDGRFNGMLLSSKFSNCRSDTCLKGIAVHEFGHALGFAHEQARTDTPESCESRQQSGETDGDMYIGSWDINSVMNYCNPKYNNRGKLSETDIIAVQRVYGKPEPQPPVIPEPQPQPQPQPQPEPQPSCPL